VLVLHEHSTAPFGCEQPEWCPSRLPLAQLACQPGRRAPAGAAPAEEEPVTLAGPTELFGATVAVVRAHPAQAREDVPAQSEDSGYFDGRQIEE
jgi:hypothetical protein